MSSGIEVDEQVQQVYDEMKMAHKHSYMICKISDDKKKIEVEKVGKPCGDSSEDFKEFKEALRGDKSRYAVLDFHKGKQDEKLVYVQCIKDNCNIKEKMIYASSADAIKKKCNGTQVFLQCCDDDEIDEEQFENKMKKK